MGRPATRIATTEERTAQASVNISNRAGKAKGRRYAKMGVTNEFYELMLDYQHGECGICKRHRSEFKISFAVDHCHDTGRVRGLLCANCNTGLGLLKDSRHLLARASRWLMTDEELGIAS